MTLGQSWTPLSSNFREKAMSLPPQPSEQQLSSSILLASELLPAALRMLGGGNSCPELWMWLIVFSRTCSPEAGPITRLWLVLEVGVWCWLPAGEAGRLSVVPAIHGGHQGWRPLCFSCPWSSTLNKQLFLLTNQDMKNTSGVLLTACQIFCFLHPFLALSQISLLFWGAYHWD